ncbi:hypothetical protein LVJ94_21150 [Pendulispora rubella]|uniref:Uncharacterized protein n=1 Tax=Pendulispora rubella TaxID=2741070 RepID=A0ABZ2LFL4_9BACT
MRTIVRKNWKAFSSLTALLLVLGITSQLGACARDEESPLAVQPSPSTADASDAGDAGEPILTHKTSWLGEWLLPEDARYRNPDVALDYPGTNNDGFQYQKRRWIHPRIDTIWVDPSIPLDPQNSLSGRIYTNSAHGVEAARTLGVYKYYETRVGTDKGAIRPVPEALEAYAQGNDGRAVTSDDKYLYADALFKEGDLPDGGPKLRRVLVRFDPNNRVKVYDWIAMSPFDGGVPVRSSITAGLYLSGTPGGLAAGYPAGTTPPHFVFVSLPGTNEIQVLEREGMTQVKTNAVTNPGALAFRASTNSLFVLEDSAGQRVVQEWKIDAAGALTPGATISNLGTPVAIAVGGNKLYVADNDLAAQQIRIYDIEPGHQYVESDRLGQPGGIRAAKGQYADDRFDNLTGVGVDKGGNIYVASSGYTQSVFGRTDIRRFSPTKQLEGKAIKHAYMDTVVVDPQDSTKVYSANRKYVLNYSNEAGQEWSPSQSSVTVDRTGCPHDGRNPHPGSGDSYQTLPLAVRYLKDSTGAVQGKYLYVRNWGFAPTRLGIYRFDADDTIARPVVAFSGGGHPWPNGETPGAPQQWVDKNADCTMGPGETKTHTGPYPEIVFGQDIDENGGIWAISNNVALKYFPVKSFIADPVGRKIPVYFENCDGDSGPGTCSDAPQLGDLTQIGMETVQQIKFAGHTLYVLGSNRINGSVKRQWRLARYDNFKIGANTLAWNIEVGAAEPCVNKSGGDDCVPASMAVAGHRIYVADGGNGLLEPGRVRTYDTENPSNSYKGSLYAGPEVAQVAGYVDTLMGISAVELPNTKEHVIFREEMHLGRILMYRYKPSN